MTQKVPRLIGRVLYETYGNCDTGVKFERRDTFFKHWGHGNSLAKLQSRFLTYIGQLFFFIFFWSV